VGGIVTFTTVTFTSSTPALVTITQTDAAGNTSAPATQVFSYSQPVSSSGGSGAVLIPTSPIIPTTGTTNTLPTTGTGKTYISPLDNKEYSCTPFTKYLKLNSKTNDATEVKLWQAFLNKHMKENLPITGYYSTLTFNAIKRFQQTYAQDVLTPWGISTPTGWTYKSTRAKGNQILGCSEGKVILDNGAGIDLK
jgi:hypothetical protein